MSYRALGENVYQLGPAPGSSTGIQFDTIVTASGLSGLRNAYRSVLSALGSCEMSGASRWLEAFAVPGLEPRTTTATATAVASAAARASAIPLMVRLLFRGWDGADSSRLADRFAVNQNRPGCEPAR